MGGRFWGRELECILLMYKAANINTNNRRKNTTGSGREVSIPLSRWRERDTHTGLW